MATYTVYVMLCLITWTQCSWILICSVSKDDSEIFVLDGFGNRVRGKNKFRTRIMVCRLCIACTPRL